MTTYHVLAAMGDFADELRALGVHGAVSARDALLGCLAQLDVDPVADQEAALPEPDVSYIGTPVDAEAHFVRDHDGLVKDAGEVERRRARMRRQFGVDAV